MALKSMLDTKEGWQAEKHSHLKVYHFIRDTMALCRGFGFYTGDLVPDTGAPRGNEDCAKCYRLLRAEQKRAAKKSATS